MKKVNRDERPYACATHVAGPKDRVEFEMEDGVIHVYLTAHGLVLHRTGGHMSPLTIEPRVSNEVLVR